MRELLDEDLYAESRPDLEAPIRSCLVPLILGAGLIYTVAEGYGARPKVIAAICCLSIASFVTFIHRKLGVKLTMAIIVLAVFRVLVFLPASYYISFGMDYHHLGFDALLFGLGMVHYLSNRNILSNYFRGQRAAHDAEHDSEEAREARVQGFKHRFARKSNEELWLTAENEELVAEARLAAREIIMERELV